MVVEEEAASGGEGEGKEPLRWERRGLLGKEELRTSVDEEVI